MTDRSKIEWTDATWNPIRARNIATGGVGHFCVHVSDGCKNCYAERLQPRFKNPVEFRAQDRDKVEIFLDEKVLTQPLRWKKPRRIFVCSMTDLFGDWVADEWLDMIFAAMALADQHTFQVLTKRPDRMRDYLTRQGPMLPDNCQARVARAATAIAAVRGENVDHPCWDVWLDLWPLHHIWLGTSIEDQATADQRVPILLDGVEHNEEPGT